MRKILRRSREERKYLLFRGQDGTSEVLKMVAVKVDMEGVKISD